jgi:adenosylcobinamide-phosphate synthase
MLAIALLLDLAFGDPPDRLHPVAWLGTLISTLLRWAPGSGALRQLAFGVFISLCAIGAFVMSGVIAVRSCAGWPLAQLLVGACLLKATFALRMLGMVRLPVRDALREGRVSEARVALRALCSRDASQLDEPLIAAACIESLAENASDSWVAPLFYYVVGGLPAALCYRAINTLDAMIGYHGRYEHLGKFAARLDDLVNLVPARLTAWLLLAAGACSGGSTRQGLHILMRDGRKTESPNAGRPMAAMAGLLGVVLEKPGHYRLGEGTTVPTATTIDTAWRIVWRASLVAAGLGLAVLGARHGR